MSTGVLVLIAAMTLVVVGGLWRVARDGGFRTGRRAGTRRAPIADAAVADTPAAELVADLGSSLGEHATLVQFSSAFCAPCRATRQVLSDVVRSVEGVVHVEVDAEQHLEAVRRLGVLRTPTTLVLDAAGREVARATGAPRKDQVLAAIASVERPADLNIWKSGSHGEI